MQLPARYDHVGSFLRPKYLLEAREQKARGEITPEQLRTVEDKAITEIVKFQEDIGLKSITDGEFRRTYFHIDFLEQLGGVKTDIPVTIRKPDGTEELAPPVMRVVDKVTQVGGEAFVSKGLTRTIIGLVGDIDSFHGLNLRTLPGVGDVQRISDPFKLVSRQHHPERSTVWVGAPGQQVPIGPDTFTFIAGPCAVESPQQTLEAVEMARAAGA